jgi:hypothetical protein
MHGQSGEQQHIARRQIGREPDRVVGNVHAGVPAVTLLVGQEPAPVGAGQDRQGPEGQGAVAERSLALRGPREPHPRPEGRRGPPFG